MAVMDWKKETRNNPIYPKGTYRVRLDSWERVTSKPTQKSPAGTPQIRWKASIIAPDDFQGRTFIDHTALTQAALWRVANMVAGFGVIIDSKMDTDSQAFNEVCNACIGRTAFWRNDDGVDLNGNPKNNVVEFKVDDDQGTVSFESGFDAPDFVK